MTHHLPPGLTTVGVTKAVQATDLVGLTAHDVGLFSRMASDALLEDLRKITKDTPPVGDLRFSMGDSVDDPLQGVIVPMTLQGDYRVDDLPTDSIAFQTYQQERAR